MAVGSSEQRDVCLTFAGVNFSEIPNDEIDFSEFEFGDGADFSRCKWRGVESGPEAFRSSRAYFNRAVFGGGANFTGADFGSEAIFVGPSQSSASTIALRSR